MIRRIHLSESNIPESCRSWRGETYKSPHTSLPMTDFRVTFPTHPVARIVSACRFTVEGRTYQFFDLSGAMTHTFDCASSVERLGETEPTIAELKETIKRHEATNRRLLRQREAYGLALNAVDCLARNSSRFFGPDRAKLRSLAADAFDKVNSLNQDRE